MKSASCLVLILLLLSWARPAWSSLLLALPFLVAGELMRLWGTGHLRKDKAVITSGPYAYLRDPLYLGTLTALTGLTLAARVYEMLLLVWIVFFGYYLPYKQKREGDRLSRKFGEAYDDYRKAVKSLLPRLSPYRGPDRDHRWSARLAYENSEFGTAVFFAVFYGLLAAKMFLLPGYVFPPRHLL